MTTTEGKDAWWSVEPFGVTVALQNPPDPHAGGSPVDVAAGPVGRMAYWSAWRTSSGAKSAGRTTPSDSRRTR